MDSPPSLHNNLPRQLTSLIGREREVATVCELLRRDDVHLVTLTGPPGIGKTRLGMEVAASLRGDFADGVYFVNLTPISNPKLVAQAIANVLGIKQVDDHLLLDVLVRSLSKRQVLLLLDNFEQVLPAAPHIAELLRAAPRLKALVTSRELLHLSGEHDFPVPPLALPPVLAPQSTLHRLAPLPFERLAQYEAVRLFVQRAEALKPDFAFGPDNSDAVAGICRKLDGLPLAIELAAARVRYLSPQAILDRLQNSLALLTGGAIDLPPRQRTLKATIEWSYDLLNEEEKRLFRRLAVFRGGSTLEAIEAVYNADQALDMEPLDGVASLTDKSLLQREVGVRDEPRFVLLETIHEYIKGKLDESEEAQAVHVHHAMYFTRLAERAGPELTGPQQAEWLDRLQIEEDNFRAALEWAYQNDVKLGLRLVAALSTFWIRRGYLSEVREQTLAMLSAAREAGLEATPSAARALYAAGFFMFRQGDFVSARPLCEESVQRYKALQDRDDRRGLAESLNLLGIVLSRLEGLPTRRRLHEEALQVAREIGDKWSIARSLYQLGHVARLSGDYVLGHSMFEESLALFSESGDKFNIALALIGIGQMAESQSDYQSAHSLYDESLAIYRELGDRWGITGALYSLGCVAVYQGDYAGARSIFEEHLTLSKELGNQGDIAETLEKLGRVSYFQGDHASAHSEYEESLALFHALGDKYGIARCLVGLAGTIAIVALTMERRGKDRGKAKHSAQAQAAQAAQLLGAAEALLESISFQLDPEAQQLFNNYTAAARAQLSGPGFAKAWADGRAITVEQVITLAQAIPIPEQVDTGAQPIPSLRAAKWEFGGLTRREREVATLIAEGKSNREIANELVISERTVEEHVSNILFKLGFQSRAQISAWTVEKGLAPKTGVRDQGSGIS